MSIKIKFTDLTNESRILKIAVPIFTPVTKNPDDETEKQIMERHEKFLALPEIVKDKLACTKISTIIQQIGSVYSLELLQLADISRAIRSYYFGELKLEDFTFVLAKEMNIDSTKARQIFQVVKEKIIDDQSYERALQAALINIQLSEALRIYPEVGEQLVTSQKINLRSFPDPVRPSIKNWIADYTFNLGYEKHESMARSQYLFQGANTKNLSASDKQKLAYLLKAFDEKSPVTVNKNTKQIIFSTNTTNGPIHNTVRTTSANNPTDENNLPSNLSSQFRPTSAPKEEPKNINSMQFSYRQTLPYEKNTAFSLSPQTPIINRATEHAWGKSRETMIDTRSMDRISQGEPQKILTGGQNLERIAPSKPSSSQNLPKNVIDLKNINQ